MRQFRIGSRLVIAGLVVLAGCVAVNGNFKTVEKNEFYRSGQMSPSLLENKLNNYEIKTVVNFRGTHPEEEWYRDEVAVCEQQGATHHDFTWSKSRLPEPAQLAQYLQLCREAPKPMLVHCQGGIHRAGVGSACYVLLKGGSVEEARDQLGLFFDDAPIGRLLDLYEGSTLPFEEWVQTQYPALYEAEQQKAQEAAPAEGE